MDEGLHHLKKKKEKKRETCNSELFRVCLSNSVCIVRVSYCVCYVGIPSGLGI